MFNPIHHALSLQHAALRGVMAAGQVWTESWMKLVNQNAESFHRDIQRRAEDWHKHPFQLPRGPCWTDYYGHRTHDIDVEHDV